MVKEQKQLKQDQQPAEKKEEPLEVSVPLIIRPQLSKQPSKPPVVKKAVSTQPQSTP